MGIAEEYNVEYTPAVPIVRKTSAEVEAEAAAAAASGPQPAYEVPGSRRQSTGGGSGGGGGGGAPPPGGGGGGVSSPPPVTAWAVPPSDGLPLATATVSPQHSFDGGSGGGAGWNPVAPQDVGGHYAPGETVKGHYGGPHGGGAPRRGSGGFEEATMGWGPSDGSQGGGSSVYDEKKMEAEDAPPPYSPPRNRHYDPNDIPAAPSERPMTYDIPAAPG